MAKTSAHKFFLWAKLAFLLFLTWLIYAYSYFSLLVAYLISINIAAFIFCAYDKGIASTKATRVPEIVLFLSAFLGGSLGLIFGMNLLRHKTQKPSFQFVVALILFVQLALLKYFSIRHYLYK